MEPRSTAEWNALISAVNSSSNSWRQAALNAFPADVQARSINGVHVYVITPKNLSPSNSGRHLIHLHGGAYVFFRGEYGITEGIIMAHYARMQVISVDYRMPPQNPFPAALDDSVTVWKALLHKNTAKSMGVFGASAGGGLTLAMVLRLKQLHVPLPGAIAPGSPWSDLTETGDSYFTNRGVDNVAVQYDGLLASCARLYAGTRALNDPLISPVYGDFATFPPTILTTGTRDLFLSNTVRVYRKLRNADVDARIDIYEGQSHAQYLSDPQSIESKEALSEIASFFQRNLSD